MKKSRWVLAIVIAIVAAVGVMGYSVSAGSYLAADEKGEVKIAADQVVDSSVYLAGDKIAVDGTVQGDIYCAGRDIVINGTVDGDVLCAGSNVIIGGTVKGDVRATGSTVIVRGTVERSMTLAASNVTIEKGATIGRDVTGGASTLIMSGMVGRDMLAGASIAEINGVVGRDVRAGFDTLRFGAEGKIVGSLDYASEREMTIGSGAVGGSVSFHKSEQSSQNNLVLPMIYKVVALVILTLGVVLVAPRSVHTAAIIPSRSVLIAFLAGFAGLILLPLLAMLLIGSAVGALLGGLIMLVWLVMIMLAWVLSA